MLETLGDQRILRAVGDEDGEGAYEIFHDVLADAVLAWQGRFTAERQLELERAAGRARHRRLVAVVGVSLFALAVMAGVTVYALSQRSDARSSARTPARAPMRSTRSRSCRAIPSRASPSGCGPALEPSSPLVEPTLRDALLATRGLHSFPGGGGRVHDAEFSPDGALVATAGGKEARLFHAATGILAATLPTGAPVEDVSFAPDGRTLVTAGANGRAPSCGTPGAAGSCGLYAAAARSPRRISRPTGASSSRPAPTARRRSGTRAPAGSSTCSATRRSFAAPPSTRAAERS